MKKIIITILVVAVFASCKDFLEPYPNAVKSEDYIFSNQNAVQGLVGRCYNYMATNYDNNEGAYFDAATDNAVMTSLLNDMTLLAEGNLGTSSDPFATYWKRDYMGIYNTNMFLKDDRGYKTDFLIDSHSNALLKKRLKGEAFALRAWFQWDLLKKFGGTGVNGQLLGFPILLEPINVVGMSKNEIREKVNFKRNTYEECVLRIIADCDSAYKYLPVAHRNFLTAPEDKNVLGEQNWGRMDGITTVAIKALVYLQWASPRFNPANDMTRWENAAKFAKEVMDFKMTVDNVTNGFDPVKRVNWLDPNNPEIVFSSRYNNANEAMEKAFYPGSFQGNGLIGATQELVDAFGMADGYPIGESPNYTYDPQNPYENRDPRFYSVIFYNDRTVHLGNPASQFTFQVWEGAKDAPNVSSKNSRTGYYVKKFLHMGLNWSDNNISRMPRSKYHIRWAHMVLAFAEAANQIGGPNVPAYGMSAKEAIGLLRKRNTYDDQPGLATDPYLELMALKDKKSFDLFLRNERRIETCFEGMWFYDLRRWSTSLGALNKPVHGVKVVRNADNTFVYEYSYEAGKREFASAYLPLPYKEVLTMSELVQNQGWDAWR